MENNSRLTEEQVLELGPLIDLLEETGPAGYRYLQKLDPALPGLEFTTDGLRKPGILIPG